MKDSLAAQLRSLKKVLIFGVAFLGVSAATDVYFVWDDLRENTERRLGRTFREQADSLTKSYEWETLLQLATERQKQNPRDPYGPFYVATAHEGLGNFKDAEESIKRMAEVAPSWEKNARDWLRKIKQQQKTGSNSS